jgi:HSP20 family protein
MNRAPALPDWAPTVDIIENDSAYVFKAELPGVKKADLDVWVEQGVLHIAGERKAETEEPNFRYHRIERSHGAFARSFALPQDANAEAISARFEDGILTVTVNKVEQAKPRKIEIKVN